MTVHRRLILSLGVVLAGIANATSSGAQTIGELGVRDAFLVAPVTAFAPVDQAEARQRFVIRGAGWLYYTFESIHWNLGVSVPVRATDRTTVSVLLARISPACDGCRTWVAGSLDMSYSTRDWLSIRGSVGAGKPWEWTNESSASLSAGLAARARWAGVKLSLQPGIALAGIDTRDQETRGVRPVAGITLTSATESRINLELGVQVVVNRGSSPVVGAALYW